MDVSFAMTYGTHSILAFVGVRIYAGLGILWEIVAGEVAVYLEDEGIDVHHTSFLGRCKEYGLLIGMSPYPWEGPSCDGS